MPVALEVAFVLLREVLRALAVPLHVLAFLPQRSRAIAASQAALDASLAASRGDPLPAFVASHVPPGGGRGRIFVSCGEASGETHARNLVAAVRHAATAGGRMPPTFAGFGGTRLAADDVRVVFPLAEHAVMGVAGVLASIPLIVRAFVTFLRILRDERPDVVVLIDYPGLHLVMAEAARRRGVPVVHYVAPQYWAWGPWRLVRYRAAVDASLTILPFEPAFFAGSGIATDYVGHPLLDELARATPRPYADPRPLLVLMPGSRRKEIALQLAPMLRVAARLRESTPDLRVVIPHVDAKRAAAIATAVREHGAADTVEVVADDPSHWLPHARAALVKSGTGALLACLHGTPTCVVYVVDRAFARWLLRRLLTVPFFAAANLCMARRIVPELAIERPAQWDAVHDALVRLWNDGPDRSRCRTELAALRDRLGAPGASDRVARWLVPFCPSRDA